MLKNLILMTALFWCFDSCYASDDINWLRASANTSTVIDWFQTKEIARNNEYIETNKYLGVRPTQREVDRYFISLLLIYNIVGELLPKQYSDIAYISFTAVHGSAVVSNYNIGVKIRF